MVEKTMLIEYFRAQVGSVANDYVEWYNVTLILLDE